MQGKSSLNQILYEVTKEKITELQNQKETLVDYYNNVLDRANAAHDLLDEIQILYNGIKDSPVPQKININLASVTLFIQHMANHCSTSDQVRRQWIEMFRKEIKYSIGKCTYSYIFANNLQAELSDPDSSALDSEFYEVPEENREKMNEPEKTIKELEERVFESDYAKSDELKRFLDQVFDSDTVEVKTNLKLSRMRTEKFCEKLLAHEISTSELKSCIDGLLSMALFSKEKQSTLRQLRENQPYLVDLATLLTSRIRSIKSWSWPQSGVYVDVRRSIIGRYRAFLDEDIITALFLQYIGVSFSVRMKTELRRIYYQINNKRTKAENYSIYRQRLDTVSSNSLSVLPDSMQSQGKFAHEYTEEGYQEQRNNPVSVKHSVIHLLATDAQLHKTIHPEKPFTVVRTDMEWFGPSIEHESVKVLMEFLGVTDVSSTL